jgi:hypothetical protein
MTRPPSAELERPSLRDTLRRRLWRLGSPSGLLLALLLFPLPWVEIQCASQSSTAPPGGTGNPVEIIYNLIPWRDAVTMFTQSGLQAALGTCTANRQFNEPDRAQQEMNDKMRGSPLMAAFPVPVLAGALGGLLLALGRRRRLLVGVCAAAALLLLAVQVGVGFPLDEAMRQAFAEDLERQAQGQSSSVVYITYTAWFALAVLGLLAALSLTAGEGWYERRRSRRAAEVEPTCVADGEPQTASGGQ